MAPDAELWDIRIWQPEAEFETYVSNAEQGYQLVIEHYKMHGVPQILVNSWGVYDSDNGPDYAFNPTSNIALLIEEALDEGILILFAAGNCGDGCPYASGSLCGYGNRGPGASILGPNGHPEVMSVGAATLRGEWCGYTSQGPAVLPPQAPRQAGLLLDTRSSRGSSRTSPACGPSTAARRPPPASLPAWSPC